MQKRVAKFVRERKTNTVGRKGFVRIQDDANEIGFDVEADEESVEQVGSKIELENAAAVWFQQVDEITPMGLFGMFQNR